MSDGFQFSTFGPKRGVKVVTTLSAQSLTPVPDRVAETPTSLGDAYGADFHKYFESEPESEPNLAPESPKVEPVTFDAIPAKPAVEACAEAAKASRGERRGRRRALISAPVRLRSVDVTIAGPDEVTTTADVSRAGLLFITMHPGYYRGMALAVTFPHSKELGATQAEQSGRVVRVTEVAEGRRSVAVALGEGIGEDLVDSGGQKLVQHAPPVSLARGAKSNKPLILALDRDDALRESLKTYLSNEGYEVIAVKTAAEAREVLTMFTPSLLIAEIEGEGMPGFDLCSHVKATPRLQTIPVMLTTSSAYPSDYASAHSLGAVVCMAKPYKQERLGHVVRLLAPPPNANACAQRPHPVDPSRRTGAVRDKAAPGGLFRRLGARTK
jgi:CheY-like chemotaxis protein